MADPLFRAHTRSWHETQAVYSCDFQPLPVGQLKKLLPAAADEEEKREREEREKSSSSVTPAGTPAAGAASPSAAKKEDKPSGGSASGIATPAAAAAGSSSTPVRQYRLATAGGDSKVRVSDLPTNRSVECLLTRFSCGWFTRISRLRR